MAPENWWLEDEFPFTETLFPGASCWFQGGYHPQKYKRSTSSISIHVLHLSVYFEPSFRFLPRKSGGNSDSEIWQASVQPNSSITLKSFTVPCIRTWKIFHFEGLQGDLSVFTGEAVERGEACGVFFSNTLPIVFSDLSKKPKRGGFQLRQKKTFNEIDHLTWSLLHPGKNKQKKIQLSFKGEGQASNFVREKRMFPPNKGHVQKLYCWWKKSCTTRDV